MLNTLKILEIEEFCLKDAKEVLDNGIIETVSFRDMLCVIFRALSVFGTCPSGNAILDLSEGSTYPLDLKPLKLVQACYLLNQKRGEI